MAAVIAPARAHLIEINASRPGSSPSGLSVVGSRATGTTVRRCQQRMLNPMLALRLANVTVCANSDNGEQPGYKEQ